jgi:hypothetical protein
MTTIALPPADKIPATLAALAAYATSAWERQPRAEQSPVAIGALRDLLARHRAVPTSAAQSLSEAYGLLKSHGMLEDFIRWGEGPGLEWAGTHSWPVEDETPAPVRKRAKAAPKASA